MFAWLFFIFIQIGLAADKMHLLVLDFSSVGEVDTKLLLQLSDETRGAALDVFPNQTSQINVLTRESLMDFVSQQGKDASCLEGECAVDIARNIEADFVLVGTVYAQEDTFRVNIKAFHAESNQLLGDITVSQKNISQLLSAVHDQAFDLIENKIGPYDEGRKGIETIRPKRYTVEESTYTLLQIEDDMIKDADIQVNQTSVCHKRSASVCRALVTRGELVTVSVQKPGYAPITKKVQISNSGEIQSVSLKFIPRFGILQVSSLDPFGQRCEGKVFIDEKPVGQTPWSDKVLAVQHTVMVDCAGMRKRESVIVTENQTVQATLQVLPFSEADLRQSQQRLFMHRALDWGLLALSGTTASIAASQLSKSQDAFTEAANIGSAADASAYQQFIDDGEMYVQKANVNLIIFGVSSGLGVGHSLWFTKRSKQHRDEIVEIRRASE